MMKKKTILIKLKRLKSLNLVGYGFTVSRKNDNQLFTQVTSYRDLEKIAKHRFLTANPGALDTFSNRIKSLKRVYDFQQIPMEEIDFFIEQLNKYIPGNQFYIKPLQLLNRATQ